MVTCGTVERRNKWCLVLFLRLKLFNSRARVLQVVLQGGFLPSAADALQNCSKGGVAGLLSAAGLPRCHSAAAYRYSRPGTLTLTG